MTIKNCPKNLLIPALLAWPVAFTVFLFIFLQHLRIDYFDTYEIFLNAKRFLGLTDRYYLIRPVLMPLLLTPLFYLEHLGWSGIAVPAAHHLAVFFYIAALWAFYRLQRLSFDRTFAVLGVFLFSLNRLIIHYAPFVKEDIPGLFFVTSAFYFYLKNLDTGKPKYYFLSILALTLAIADRYQLYPLLAAILVLHRRLPLRQMLWIVMTPFLILLLIQSFVLTHTGFTKFHEGAAGFIGYLAGYYNHYVDGYYHDAGPHAGFQNAMFLWRACSAPVLLLSAVGMAGCLRQKRPHSDFLALWFVLGIIFFAFGIKGEEARYLFPIYPPVYFFAVAGVQEIRERFHKISKPVLRFTAAAAAILIFIGIPLKEAAAEALRFRSPIYRVPFEKEVSDYAKELAGDKDIIWVGPYYPIHPKDYIFDIEDEYAYLYHFWFHAVKFYTHKQVRSAENAAEILKGQNVLKIARDGDVLIVNEEPHFYNTKNLPAALRPLRVQKLRVSGSEIHFDSVRSFSIPE
jgi:hypothetical protein